jgi:hypothetical protein
MADERVSQRTSCERLRRAQMDARCGSSALRRPGAEEAERKAIARVLETGKAKKPVPPRKEVPTVREFSKTFIETSRVINKASSIDAKNAVSTVTCCR